MLGLHVPYIKIRRRSQQQPSRTSVPLGFSIDRADAEERLEIVQLPVQRSISRRKNAMLYLFAVDAPSMTREENALLAQEKAHVIELLSSSSAPEHEFGDALRIATDSLSGIVGAARASYLSQFVAHDVAGYGPISMLLEDKQNLEEIEINTPIAPISIYHTRYGRCATNIRFNSEESFRHSINKMIYEAGEEINDENPIIDAQVGDARVHAQLKPYSVNGAIATVRLGGRRNLNIQYMLGNGTATADALAYLWMAIDSRMNIVVSGAPASGKTTLLTALLALVPRFRRIITIEEDVNELKFYPDVSSIIPLYGSRFASKVTVKEQAINALRLRPDLLIIGEIRGSEARDLFSGTNLGIPFMTTMHSNENGMSVIKRLTTQPMAVEAEALSALDLSIYMRQDGITSRRLAEICEYRWLSRAEETNDYIEVNGADGVKMTNVVENGVLNPAALASSKVLAAYSSRNNAGMAKVMKEFSRRKKFLEGLQKTTDTLELMDAIQNYPVSA